jgi:hypothetical protein
MGRQWRFDQVWGVAGLAMHRAGGSGLRDEALQPSIRGASCIGRARARRLDGLSFFGDQSSGQDRATRLRQKPRVVRSTPSAGEAIRHHVTFLEYPVVISCSRNAFCSAPASFAKPANKPGLHHLRQNRIAMPFYAKDTLRIEKSSSSTSLPPILRTWE